MTIGQIVMYHNLGLEIKYPKPQKDKDSLMDKSHEELVEIRDELREKYGEI